MRQIFSSPRLENVEGVARMLEDAGIETWVSGGRSYRGQMRRNFSYKDGSGPGPMPAVWIVNAEDQTRAREMLRGAGLIDSTREGSFLPETFAADNPRRKPPAAAMAMRIKLALLAVIGFFGVLILLRMLGGG